MSDETAVTNYQKPAPPIEMGERGVVVKDMGDLWTIANKVHSSGACPDKASCNDVYVAMLKGAELGFGPLQAVWSIPVVKGRPTLEGKASLGLVRSRNATDPRGPIDCGCTGKGDDRVGWCESWPAGALEMKRTEFTWDQAKNAGLTGKTKSGHPGMYMKYGEDMLKWKAVGRHMDTYFSHITHGLMLEMTGEEVYGAAGETVRGRAVDMTPSPSAPAVFLGIPAASADTEGVTDAEVVTGEPGKPEMCMAMGEDDNFCELDRGHDGPCDWMEFVNPEKTPQERDMTLSVCGSQYEGGEYCMFEEDHAGPHDWVPDVSTEDADPSTDEPEGFGLESDIGDEPG